MTRRRSVQAVLACSAAAGLVGAHAIAYVIALPDAALRTSTLRMTGHDYLSAAAVVAIVAGIFGVLGAAAIGFRSGRSWVTPRWRNIAPRVAAVQALAFLMLEVAERAAATVPPLAVSPRVLAVGLVVQVLLAVIAALVVVFVVRTARAAAEILHAAVYAPRRPYPPRVVLSVASPRGPALAGAPHARAPPASPR